MHTHMCSHTDQGPGGKQKPHINLNVESSIRFINHKGLKRTRIWLGSRSLHRSPCAPAARRAGRRPQTLPRAGRTQRRHHAHTRVQLTMRFYKAESTLTCDSTRHARDLLTGFGASCEPRRAEHCDRLCRLPWNRSGGSSPSQAAPTATSDPRVSETGLCREAKRTPG